MFFVDGFGAEALRKCKVDAVAGAPGAADCSERTGLGRRSRRTAVDLDGRGSGEPRGDAEVDRKGDWMLRLQFQGDAVFGWITRLLVELDGDSRMDEVEPGGDVLADIDA